LNSESILHRKLPFYLGDLFEPVEGKFDIIVSNPPYLEQADMDRFREINWPEPELALFGGKNGLEIIGRLIKKSVAYLNRNGYLLLEAAPFQMDAIGSMLEKENFSSIRRIGDLGGRERVIVSRFCYG
jgi:release factor glutamine methyltransferase